jgi:hypothetical protein
MSFTHIICCISILYGIFLIFGFNDLKDIGIGIMCISIPIQILNFSVNPIISSVIYIPVIIAIIGILVCIYKFEPFGLMHIIYTAITIKYISYFI